MRVAPRHRAALPPLARELTIIAGLSAAEDAGSQPPIRTLFTAIKNAHQVAHGQLAALARLEGTSTVARVVPVAAEPMTLPRLLAAEQQFADDYAQARDFAEGLHRDVLARLTDRAEQRVCLLLAHVVKLTRDEDLAAELPLPLSRYFAAKEHRACLRCLLDRPGTLPAMTRTDPEAFVCAACHDEVMQSLPPDLAAVAKGWPAPVREARVVQRALSHSSKQTARDTVHTVIAGQAPRRPKKKDQLSRDYHAGPSAPVEPLATTLRSSRDEATPEEQRYDELLFDYRSLRDRW